MVDVGMGHDEQIDIGRGEADLGQLGGRQVLGRQADNPAKLIELVFLGRFFDIGRVFGREAGIDQDILAVFGLDQISHNADNSAVGVDLKEAKIEDKES